MPAAAWIALAALLLTNAVQFVREIVRYGMRRQAHDAQTEAFKKLEVSISERFDRSERATAERFDNAEEHLGDLRDLITRETEYLRRRTHRVANIIVNFSTRLEMLERNAGLPVAPGVAPLLDDLDKEDGE